MGEDPELTRKYLESLERPKVLDHDCSVSELTGRQSECEMATLRRGTKNKKHPDGCLLWCLGSEGRILSRFAHAPRDLRPTTFRLHRAVPARHGVSSNPEKGTWDRQAGLVRVAWGGSVVGSLNF